MKSCRKNLLRDHTLNVYSYIFKAITLQEREEKEKEREMQTNSRSVFFLDKQLK